MDNTRTPAVAIVDHGLGNLRSVEQACAFAGMHASITSDRRTIADADAVILPGVGAFGDAMRTLHRLDLVSLLRDIAASPTPLVGICLGVQLLMTESVEFGHHQGLAIIEGEVVPLDKPKEGDRLLKVPQIGWNRVHCASRAIWDASPMHGIDDGDYMYFVHSYVVRPQDGRVVLSTTRYGHIEFCSGVVRNNVFACQFHPERSGVAGLRVYQNLAATLQHAAQGARR